MAHDVFISYSSQDKPTADAVCAVLETNGIRCWIAPRDVVPGQDWGASLVGAIKGARVMVLVFSAHANYSPQIKREVERAVNHGIPIIPLRIEEVAPSPSLEYFISTPHWLDAFTPPLERHLQYLTQVIQKILGILPEDAETNAPVEVPESFGQEQTPGKHGKIIWASAVIALALLGAGGWWLNVQSRKTTGASAGTKPNTPQSIIAGQCWTNSLGMVFTPVPGTKVLFSIWDTRVQDYRAYASANEGVDRKWQNPGFIQGDTHPVVNVSWEDAKAYCGWLTQKERNEGEIGPDQSYRLPTDAEWSVAVGLNECAGGIPVDKDSVIKGVYPWGTQWPPPRGAGNYASSLHVDDYENTSPVGSFQANRYGLYDMGGNVWQWCEDLIRTNQDWRVMRGGSWDEKSPENNDPNYHWGCNLLSSCRAGRTPSYRWNVDGFRIVCVVDNSSEAAANPAPAQIKETSDSITPSVVEINRDQSWTFTTIAGQAGISGARNGIGRDARFNIGSRSGIALDRSGNLYVVELQNNDIRLINPSGIVSTLAGKAGTKGSSDGMGDNAMFSNPRGIAVDISGNAYVADAGNHTIRKIAPSGMVTTFAGKAGISGTADGPAAIARFDLPNGIAVGPDGSIFVADGGNTIRKITPEGVVSTVAGQAGIKGSMDGLVSNARFNEPYAISVGTNGLIYVTEWGNNIIRVINSSGMVSTLAGQAGVEGSDDGETTNAQFHIPSGIAVDGEGNLYVTDSKNNTIRKITSAGMVTTIGGLAKRPGSKDGAGEDACFNAPVGIAVDSRGNIYVSDDGNNTIRKGHRQVTLAK
jgi:streptogramin lyase